MAEYSQLTIDLLTSFVILIITLVLGNILSNILKRVLKGIALNTIVEKGLSCNLALEQNLANLLKYLIYLFGFISILNVLGISSKILWILFAIFLVIIVVFTALSLKDIVPNIMSGVYINKTKKIRRGESIKVKGIEGKVLAIKLVETKIETENGEIVFIPNSILTKEEIVKVSK